MQELLLEINDVVNNAGGSLSKQVAQKFGSRYRNILAKGDRECPAPDPKVGKGKRGQVAKTKFRNLLERLRNLRLSH